ncbi:MAG: response regulator transcription factor [Actinomycetia bacterium]|nr:response regulator transcription factor [Actinomycetes bacterium]
MADKGLILMVEDDKELLNANKLLLENEGYSVITAERLSAAWEQLAAHKPDVILLDIMLPDGSGLNFLVELRKTSMIPVLMLTALDSDADVVQGLEVGGDDYLVKPFARSVLLARVGALMRRARATEVMEYGTLKLNMKALAANLNGVDLMLTQKDFSLLRYFTQNENRFITSEQLYEQVWNQPLNENTQAIRSATSRLRSKLAGSGYTIVSVRGKGYCFQKSDDESIF